MDADLQVPLPGPLEIFFLFREKKKFVKKKKKRESKTKNVFLFNLPAVREDRHHWQHRGLGGYTEVRGGQNTPCVRALIFFSSLNYTNNT